jgi:protein-disulfide isomerase
MTRKRSTATRRAESQAAAERAAAIRAEQERQERRRRTLVVSAVVVAVLAIVLVLGYVVQSGRDTSGTAASAPSGVVGGYAVPAGPADAPVKVAVYEDFMCPFCGQFEAASRSSLERHIEAGDVQVQYHVLNFLDRSSSTKYSTRAANALAVVLDTSGPTVAKKFHDLLFEHQPAEGSAGLSDAQLVDYAVQAGAKASKVRPGIDDLRFEQWVGNVTDRASKDGVTGTPTVRIDGKTLEYQTTDELVAEVDKAIAKAR